MATRRERIILDVEDNATAKFARAAAGAQLLDRSLNDLSGHAVQAGRDLDGPARGADQVGDSSSKAGPEIDKLSGRLRLLADAAVVLGPALVPLGAATIPVLSGSLIGLTAAAGGIGVTIAAFTGLGDALTALNDYQLEPTAENLQALRLEQEKMGPSGAALVRYLDSLGPVLKDLQFTARDGLFPGVEDGIDSLLTRLPEVTKIVNRLSQTMGDLASDTGSALGGEEFDSFFQYLKTDAAPTLDAFARSAGNLAVGAANLLVGLAPATRDFTSGLLESTNAFAEWSKTLDESEGFQDFLAHIRENAPKAKDLLGQIGLSIGAIFKAAAPWGEMILPVVTNTLKVFEAIASSDAGPALYAAAAGLIAFNRAAAITAARGPALRTALTALGVAGVAGRAAGGLGLVAASMTDLDDKAGLANTAMFSMAGLLVGGPWGLAIGAAAGATADLAAANNDLETAVSNANRAMGSNNFGEMKTRYQELSEQIEKTKKDSDIDWFGDPYTLGETVDALGATWSNLSGGTDKAVSAQEELQASMSGSRGVAELLAGSVGLTAKELYDAAGAAEDFSGALAELNGWLDKREALRGYRDGVKELSKDLKDGFGRKDVENIDAVGRNIAQVASLIKDRGLRADFLAGARKSLVDMANGAGPKARAEIEELIGALDRYGLTKPPTPKLDADDKPARGKVKNLKGFFETLVGHPYNAKLTANGDQAVAEGNRVLSVLGRIVSKTVTITVKKIGNAIPEFAEGGYTGDGGKYEPRGVVHAGEVVIPQRYVRRDFASLKARYPDLPGFADGGLVQNTYVSRGDSDPDKGKGGKDRDQDKMRHTVTLFLEGMTAATHGFKAYSKVLKAEEEQRKKALDRAKSALAEAVGRRDQIASGITSGLAGDIWADIPAKEAGPLWGAGSSPATKDMPATPASALAALQKQRADTQRFLVALNTLKQKGITGPVLLEIIGTGDVERAEMMAALPIEELTSFASVYTAASSELAAAGLAGGNALEGANIKTLEKQVNQTTKAVHEVVQAIRNLDHNNQQSQDKAADKVKDGVNGASGNGHRRGKRGGR